MLRSARFLLLGSMLTACSGGMMSDLVAPDAASLDSRGGGIAGAVFSETNSPAGNAVLVFRRSADGSLSAPTSVAAGGTGTGAGLGSQGAVTLSADGNWLLVVNAGSNEVSSFEVGDAGALTLRGKASSGGTMPISVAIHGNLVYVLNAGGSGNIAGLRLQADGSLAPIASSSRGLSTAAAGPAEVAFDPTGAWLVVTEKTTNKIDTWRVTAEGLATGRVINAASGITPFGFTFTSQGVLAVTEAFGGAANASAVSTYTINPNGTLSVISASTPTTETSACWIVATNNAKFVYATNASSASVSGFSARNGALELLDADGKSGITGAGATDVAITSNSQYLYSLNGGAHTISVFGVSQSRGDLNAGTPVAAPVGAVGIAAK
jgi:6-phosphogluconolactonase (cycloisomerase 2 family)